MQKIIFSILAIGLSMGVLAQKQMVNRGSLEENPTFQIADHNFKVNATFDSKAAIVYYPSIFGAGGCANIDSMINYATTIQDQNIPIVSTYLFDGAGQGYTFSNTRTITGVAVVMRKIYDGDVVDANIELMNSNRTSVLATTTYNTADLSEGGYTTITSNFSQPVNTQSCFLGVSFPAYSQTSTDVLIPTTRATCSAGTPIYLLAEGEWIDASSVFGGFDANLFAFPIVESGAGVSETDLNDLTYIYPNPANEQVIIASSVKMDKVEIYNIVGQQVFSKDVNGISTSVNTADFATGQYIVKMYTESGIAIKKMMVK
ncbi:MAG: T9SS type A sorting domain-containing protein [Bacteroidales bacterium]|nr:T9SS type A sorting domain-containing protein [Bacteroidales bacterium]